MCTTQGERSNADKDFARADLADIGDVIVTLVDGNVESQG